MKLLVPEKGVWKEFAFSGLLGRQHKMHIAQIDGLDPQILIPVQLQAFAMSSRVVVRVCLSVLVSRFVIRESKLAGCCLFYGKLSLLRQHSKAQYCKQTIAMDANGHRFLQEFQMPTISKVVRQCASQSNWQPDWHADRFVNQKMFGGTKLANSDRNFKWFWPDKKTKIESGGFNPPRQFGNPAWMTFFV